MISSATSAWRICRLAWLLFQDLTHFYPILLLVTLGAGGPYGGAARGIEQTKLDAHGVRDLGHDAAEGIDFADEVAFGDTATAGLQDIWAIRSAFRVNSAVLRPIRADAMAASQPAWPAPTTTTSNCSLNDGIDALDILQVSNGLSEHGRESLFPARVFKTTGF